LDDRTAGTPQVDGLATGARLGRGLDHGHAEPVPGQPEAEGRSSDAGPGDQYLASHHRRTPSVTVPPLALRHRTQPFALLQNMSDAAVLVRMRRGVLVPMTTESAPFQRIAADLRARIAGGELRPGDRVPSARALTRQWSVAIATASRALAALQAEGLTR